METYDVHNICRNCSQPYLITLPYGSLRPPNPTCPKCGVSKLAGEGNKKPVGLRIPLADINFMDEYALEHGTSKVEAIKRGLNLLRLVVAGKRKGFRLYMADPSNLKDLTEITI